MKVQTTPFGSLPDGRQANLYTITNNNGFMVQATNYGGIITKIEMPDKDGAKGNVVLGFDNLADYFNPAYLENYPYFGAVIGRYCNRISKGNLSIGGQSYPLAVNNGPNHLHGGQQGFDTKLWEATIIESGDEAGIKLKYLSPHLEEKYPGNLEVYCSYLLNDNNEFRIRYHASTDETTVVNLTNHTYFNFTEGKDNILNHELKLASTGMTEMSDQIPTGTIVSVLDTPYDFSEFKSLGNELKQLPYGYDDNYVLDNDKGELKYAGTLREKKSGRMVEVYTTQPGMQLYTGYWIPELELDGTKKFGSFSGIALEPQHYPDSPNHPNFPTTLLIPGDKYQEETVYKFFTGKDWKS